MTRANEFPILKYKGSWSSAELFFLPPIYASKIISQFFLILKLFN